jgi:hypothetical protein
MDTPIAKIVVNKLAEPFVRVRTFVLKQRKGWKLVKSTLKKIGIDQWRREQARATFFMNGSRDGSSYGRFNRTGWYRRNADISPLVITERMLMRHGWYRRQLRKEGVAVQAGGVRFGKNSFAFVGDSRGPVSLARKV